ncbi:hypothetical protein IKQ21_07900 [bacterium]|nr:hypothetical protein [bacterium]
MAISFLFVPITLAEGTDETVNIGADSVAQETVTSDDVSSSVVDDSVQEQTDNDVLQSQEEDLVQTPYKQPVGKKKILFKFVLAMLGVALSSFIIYFGLTLYNKLRDGLVPPDKPMVSHDQDRSLTTPENLSEAVKTFIDKTEWSD